jgi:hypothetical protein
MQTMTTPPPPTTDAAPADRDWFGGRRWTGITALAVLIALAVAVLVVILNHHTPAKTPAAGPTTTSSSTVSSTLSGGSTASPLPTTVPTAAPTGTTWSIYDTVALPSLAGAGPTTVNAAIATGYAHTPLGALLAAGNNIRIGLADDAQWRRAADAMLAPGPGKNAWLRLRSTQPWTPATPGEFTQIAGFQFVSYTPSDAVIQIVTRDVHDTFQVAPMHVSWSGSDWQLVLPASGIGTAQVTPSLIGFIPWGAV